MEGNKNGSNDDSSSSSSSTSTSSTDTSDESSDDDAQDGEKSDDQGGDEEGKKAGFTINEQYPKSNLKRWSKTKKSTYVDNGSYQKQLDKLLGKKQVSLETALSTYREMMKVSGICYQQFYFLVAYRML